MSIEAWEPDEPEWHSPLALDFNSATWPLVMERAERSLAEAEALLGEGGAEVISLAGLRRAHGQRLELEQDFPKAA